MNWFWRSLLSLFLLAPLSPLANAADPVDALEEVNALRASRGLPPFVHDDGLTQAAKSAAKYRAERLIFGHIMNGSYALDHSFAPPGTHVDTAGCAAYPASYGWLSCATFENYQKAGAAYAIGADGKRYMHLFLSGGPGGSFATVSSSISYNSGRRFLRFRR